MNFLMNIWIIDRSVWKYSNNDWMIEWSNTYLYMKFYNRSIVEMQKEDEPKQDIEHKQWGTN